MRRRFSLSFYAALAKFDDYFKTGNKRNLNLVATTK